MERSDREGRLVLVVEDDREMRRLVRAAFENAGYRVCEAENGTEALKRLGSLLVTPRSRAVPRLVVTDVRMPGHDGLSVLEASRLIDDSIPVIVFTAFGDDPTHERATRLGARAVFDKPVDVRELVEAARSILPP